ncbi:MAG: hypothetical protein WBB45_12715 [Cyclobacteriaceae bacterium]
MKQSVAANEIHHAPYQKSGSGCLYKNRRPHSTPMAADGICHHGWTTVRIINEMPFYLSPAGSVLNSGHFWQQPSGIPAFSQSAFSVCVREPGAVLNPISQNTTYAASGPCPAVPAEGTIAHFRFALATVPGKIAVVTITQEYADIIRWHAIIIYSISL